MTESGRRGGLVIAVGVSAVAGLVITAATLSGALGSATGDVSEPAATAEYGRRLLRETGALLGPDHPDPAMRYTGTRMACASCHLEVGTRPGTLTLLGAASKYPSFSGREGRDRDLIDRINGCMQRSMNGSPLPPDSIEMQSMVAYIEQLGREYAAMGETNRTAHEQAPFAEPDRRADVEAGRLVFESRCALCHGIDGQGLPATADPAGGYVFPPLWGGDSFNNGAGMHRVLTAARFIKARMPLGESDLTDDEAYDVAAYINSHPRPQMANLVEDYPDRTRKPEDSPYGPWADPFPEEQHRYGPFEPIREYYRNPEDGGN